MARREQNPARMARLTKRQIGFTDDDWESLRDEGTRQGGRPNGQIVREACRGYLRYMDALRDGLTEDQALRIVRDIWRRADH